MFKINFIDTIFCDFLSTTKIANISAFSVLNTLSKLNLLQNKHDQ